jgi:hypothetical protein
MSTRERWVVYPLLFLALGTAIKPKLVPAERVSCRFLEVVDQELRPRIRLTAGAADEGAIRIINRIGQPVVVLRTDAATRAGLIETLSDDGKPQTAMMSSATGGEVAAFDLGVRKSVALGHRDGRFGLIETELKTDLETAAPTFVPISKLAILSKQVP